MPTTALVLPATTTVLPATLAVAAVLVDLARRRTWPLRTLVWRLVWTVYLAGLVAVTFFPFEVAIGAEWQRDLGIGLNLVPGRSVELVSYKLNVLMTVPLGFLLPIVSRLRNVVTVTLVGMLTSCSIELLQLVTRLTLGATRSTDVDDVIANTIGTAIGVIVFHWCAVLARGPGRSPTRARMSGRRAALRRPCDSSGNALRERSFSD